MSDFTAVSVQSIIYINYSLEENTAISVWGFYDNYKLIVAASFILQPSLYNCAFYQGKTVSDLITKYIIYS